MDKIYHLSHRQYIAYNINMGSVPLIIDNLVVSLCNSLEIEGIQSHSITVKSLHIPMGFGSIYMYLVTVSVNVTVNHSESPSCVD